MLAIVDPCFGGRLLLDRVRAFIEERPTMGMIAYADFSRRPAQDTEMLVSLGVEWFLSLGIDDDVPTVCERIACALPAHSAPCICTALAEHIDAHALELVLRVFEHARGPLQAPDVSACLGLERRSAERRLGQAGLPGPAELACWCRLLHAARLLEDRRRTVASVAYALGFAEPSGLRKLLKQRTGLRAEDLRRRGAVGQTVARFARACGDAPLIR